MIAASLVLATALAGLAAEPIAVRTRPRPELPWVVAVLALDRDVSAQQAAAALETASSGPARALLDRGGSLSVRLMGSRRVFVAQGPPEAHDAIVAAARSTQAAVPGAGAVLFVDGRTTLADEGALPPLRKRAPAPVLASDGISSPLAPDPGLLDLEGAALAELIADTLRPHGAVTVAIEAERGRASLRLKTDIEPDRIQEALRAAVATPLAPRYVNALRTRAAGRLAERRASAGGWALDMARLYVGFGSLEVQEPADLGPRLRARIFPDRLTR